MCIRDRGRCERSVPGRRGPLGLLTMGALGGGEVAAKWEPPLLDIQPRWLSEMATRHGCQQVLEITGFMTWVAALTATPPEASCSCRYPGSRPATGAQHQPISASGRRPRRRRAKPRWARQALEARPSMGGARERPPSIAGGKRPPERWGAPLWNAMRLLRTDLPAPTGR